MLWRIAFWLEKTAEQIAGGNWDSKKQQVAAICSRGTRFVPARGGQKKNEERQAQKKQQKKTAQYISRRKKKE